MLCVFLLINVLSFALFGADKYKAKRKLFRIPESVLLLVCFVGGGIGGLAGMRVFHHKTTKKTFQILVPASIAINILMLICLIFFGLC